MAEALGIAILVIAAANLFFYAGAILCLVFGFWLWKSHRGVAAVLLLAAALPFLHYGVQVARSQFEPARRAEEIRAWAKAHPAGGVSPRSIELVNALHNEELSALVAAGVLDEVQAQSPRAPFESVAFTMVEGAECIDFADSGSPHAEFRRVVLARFAFQRCVKRIERASPADAPLQMYFGRSAPSRYRGPGCLGGGERATLELRWSASRGGQLFAFWEPPDLMPPAFPPQVLGDGQIWACPKLHPDDRRYWFADSFRFTASALGFDSPEDFPRSSDPSAPVAALRLLRAELHAAYAHDRIVALLGQWPSSPEIDREFKEAFEWESSDRWLRDAVALLSEPGEEERRQMLYPHLSSHAPTLADFCRRLTDQKSGGDIPGSCGKLLGGHQTGPAAGHNVQPIEATE